MQTQDQKISIVIPTYNEIDTIEQLQNEIEETMLKNKFRNYEVVWVDDGSTDGSWKRIVSMNEKHSPHMKAIRFRRNFGKAHALSVGFKIADGDIVMTMDADLQDDPKEIPSFIKKIIEV